MPAQTWCLCHADVALHTSQPLVGPRPGSLAILAEGPSHVVSASLRLRSCPAPLQHVHLVPLRVSRPRQPAPLQSAEPTAPERLCHIREHDERVLSQRRLFSLWRQRVAVGFALGKARGDGERCCKA